MTLQLHSNDLYCKVLIVMLAANCFAKSPDLTSMQISWHILFSLDSFLLLTRQTSSLITTSTQSSICMSFNLHCQILFPFIPSFKLGVMAQGRRYHVHEYTFVYPSQLKAGILRFPTIYNMPILPRMCSLGLEKHEFRVHP